MDFLINLSIFDNYRLAAMYKCTTPEPSGLNLIVKSLLFYVLCIIVFAGCDFQPEGQVFTDVPIPSTEGMTVRLDNVNELTIQLKDRTTFYYTIEAGGRTSGQSYVTLNDQIVWTNGLLTSSFELDPANLESGSYSLRIEYVTKSGSGSMADKMNLESLILWRDFVIVVDHSIPTTPDDPSAIKITSVQNIDQTIVVSWTPYRNFNFQHYELIREDYDEAGTYVSGFVFSPISDASQTTINDFMYVGGRSLYKLRLYAASSVYETPPFEYEHPYKPDITYNIETNGDVLIRWNSLNALRNNFFKYTVEIRQTVGQANPITFEISNLLDTTIVYKSDNFRFGATRELKLNLHPSEDYHYAKGFKTFIVSGDPFPSFDGSPPYHSRDNNFYLAINSRLNMINKSGEVVNVLQHSYWPLVTNNNYTAVGKRNNKNYLIDLSTMSEVKEIVLSDVDEFTPVGVSDNNLLLIQTETSAKVTTIEGQELLSMEFAFGYAGISPNGKYVFYGPHTYRFNGTQYEPWPGNYTQYAKSVDFISDSKIIIGTSDKVWRVDMETLNLEVQNYDYKWPCNYDRVSKLMGCLIESNYVIFDPQTFETYKTLAVDPSAGVFLLYNETVLCSSGVRIKLSDIP